MDRWAEKTIWDAALHQVRIVVSTHAVLAQALEHAFVSISRLALLVFDEGESVFHPLEHVSERHLSSTVAAHHCMKKHPANTIMRDFYHPARKDIDNVLSRGACPGRGSVDGTISLPHVLGLSASLVMKSNLRTLRWVIIRTRQRAQ